MSHLDHDESRDRNEDADAFEQQLRLLRPSPPTQSWSSIAESIEASSDQPAIVSNVQPTTSAWRSAASHSITTAIGIALGVMLMLTLQQDNSAATQPGIPTPEARSAVELVNTQDADGTQANANRREPESLASVESFPTLDQRSRPDWRSNRFTRIALRSGPLRAFGSIGHSARLMRTETEFDSRHNTTQHSDLDDDDSSIKQLDDLPRDKPALSPRSLHLFLDELTYSPTSDVPFCKAKGCQS